MEKAIKTLKVVKSVTLMFHALRRNSNVTGEKIIRAQIPDTITSWYASAFAMSENSGMGVAPPASLTAFQPLFVSLTLPYSVVRGEKLTFTATVFNYMNWCTQVCEHLFKKLWSVWICSYKYQIGLKYVNSFTQFELKCC